MQISDSGFCRGINVVSPGDCEPAQVGGLTFPM